LTFVVAATIRFSLHAMGDDSRLPKSLLLPAGSLQSRSTPTLPFLLPTDFLPFAQVTTDRGLGQPTDSDKRWVFLIQTQILAPYSDPKPPLPVMEISVTTFSFV